MKKNYITLVLSILFSATAFAQEIQKNFINYQGVARSADSQLMASEGMTINIGLKFGAANAAAVYEERHSIMTDANGVFSLLIGNGSVVSGNYNALPWGSTATFVTVSMNGKEVGTTELMAVPYAIRSGDAKQTAVEVPYDNSVSGLSATTAQEAIDALAVGGAIDTDNQALVLTGDVLSIQDGSGSVDLSIYREDADADMNNELQTLDFDPATNALSLSDGNTVIIPSGGTDADADPTNELQTISFDAATNALSLSDGGTVTIPISGTDADADPTNEFQTLSFDAGTNELSLSDGNSVTIPSGGTDADADPENEIDVTRRHGLLVGDDGIVDGLVGTADGQVAKWDAALGNWVAGADATGGGGSATGFEALDQGSGLGWRLINRNPAYYGPIGLNALDASTNGINSTTRGATGFSATAMGEETTASGPRSTAMGYGAKATGSVSTAIGEETEASGEFAVAMGDRTVASEQSSTAFGSGTRALNTHATALGESTTASGKSATAMGMGTKAESLGALAIGRNNRGGGDPFVWQPNDPLFEIGNGSDAVANNALTVLKNGKVGIGNASPTATLQVEGNILSSDLSGSGQRNVMADANGNLIIGAGTGGSSLWSENGTGIYYNTGNVGIGTDTPATLQHLHSDTASTDMLLTNGATGELVSDGLQIGIKNDLGEGLVGYIMNEENGPLRFGTNSATRMFIASGGFIGINTFHPEYRLDVDGAIRATDLAGTGQRNIMADADGKLIIGASGGGSSLWTEDAGGISYGSGNIGIGTASSPSYPLSINTDSERPINLTSLGTDNYMAYNNSSGYVGYSGVFTGDKDMDFGTGFLNGTGKVHLVTNAIPKLTVAANGDVGIGTTTPTVKLDVDGDIKTSGEIHGPSSGSANMIPRAYGRIDANGTIVSGTGNFTVNRVEDGNYMIDLLGETDEGEWVVVANAMNGFPTVLSVGYFPLSPRRFSVVCWNLSAVKVDVRFNFVVYRR